VTPDPSTDLGVGRALFDADTDLLPLRQVESSLSSPSLTCHGLTLLAPAVANGGYPDTGNTSGLANRLAAGHSRQGRREHVIRKPRATPSRVSAPGETGLGEMLTEGPVRYAVPGDKLAETHSFHHLLERCTDHLWIQPLGHRGPP
jgi:hypothetical protein